jgi:hypothetical protein
MIFNAGSLLTIVIVAGMSLITMRPAAECPNQAELFSREALEKKFGEPTKCLEKLENVTCFKGSLIQVEFNKSGYAEKIVIRHYCNGLWSIKPVALEVVPESSRGELIRRTDPTLGSCDSTYREEYVCLVMKYSEELCHGCAPAYIEITWPKTAEPR